jgi:hypothetical protein
MTEAELAAHHEAARNASVADWLALGQEQGKEDALACLALMTAKGRRAAEKLGKQQVRDRIGNMRQAGVSEDPIAAWLDAHTATFVKHVDEITRRKIA